MTNTEHLDSLNFRLTRERSQLAAAKTSAERDLRAVWVAQLEKEIAGEREFLNLAPAPDCGFSDDELAAALEIFN
jgi:hypothetical protein